MQLLGRANIKVNGDRLRSKPGARLNLGGIARNTIEGTSDIGHSEQLRASNVECTIMLAKGDSLETYRNITGATIAFECDTGQVYVIREAFVTNTLEVTEGSDSGVSLTFAGEPAEEMG